MVAATSTYDGAAYCVDRAVDLALRGAREEAAQAVVDAHRQVAASPYPHLVRDFQTYGTAAVAAIRSGELERAVTFLSLCQHVIDDMRRFESDELDMPV
ncbi:hypothetical protein [Natronomonas sp. EA1]|uniref:hypothetical protein n=1 Tax=Natronomonas sp. EA1 TaxID=3421655 RepID=UPI003EB95E82